jgi:hypothetical protein
MTILSQIGQIEQKRRSFSNRSEVARKIYKNLPGIGFLSLFAGIVANFINFRAGK